MNTTYNFLEQIISNRRTAKSATMNGQLIDDNLVKQILALANWAPTHGHTEPWRFIVYNNMTKKDFCNAHAAMYKQHTPQESFVLATFEKLQQMSDKASHIVVVYNKRGDNAKIPPIEEIVASSIAMQNILLGAEALNIAVHLSTGGMMHKQPMKDYFNLTDEDTMLAILYLGYSDEQKAGKRLTSIESKVEWR
ncbi:MAG: nitroreductase [Chitinophagaceae bacterium]|nr:nitroreductase [Chitinophagaceae bacterium]MCW5905845.1 nitroreductase [Chitinophagaceae bacterium]